MIARAEAGSGREGMVEFDIGLAAADLFELYEPMGDDCSLSLSISTEPDLYIHGSRELIGQAIANLLDNAIKYAAPDETPGERLQEITLQARRIEDLIEIIVADNGPGIGEKDRLKVLERFVRLENSRTKPGSGLGLSLVAAVAHLHLGSLKLEDNNPGLRAVLRLPACVAPNLSLALPPPPERLGEMAAA